MSNQLLVIKFVFFYLASMLISLIPVNLLDTIIATRIFEDTSGPLFFPFYFGYRNSNLYMITQLPSSIQLSLQGLGLNIITFIVMAKILSHQQNKKTFFTLTASNILISITNYLLLIKLQ